MEPMVAGATHQISVFTFVVMGLTVVICALLYVASIIMPEWKTQAIKGIIAVAIGGLILAFGKPFIDWLATFNSF